MNEREQRQHKSRLEELTKTIEEMVAMVDQRLTYQTNRVDGLDRSINDERTHRLKLAEEQRRYVDRLERELRDTMVHYFAVHSEEIERLKSPTTFWDRLRWLFTGNLSSPIDNAQGRGTMPLVLQPLAEGVSMGDEKPTQLPSTPPAPPTGPGTPGGAPKPDQGLPGKPGDRPDVGRPGSPDVGKPGRPGDRPEPAPKK